MSIRTPFARFAPGVVALASAIALAAAVLVPATAGAATTTAKLRVLTPTQVLDPGTTYIVDDSVTVPTRPEADCLGPPGGSGATFSLHRAGSAQPARDRRADDPVGEPAPAQ